jgi:TRAP-type C4-dicarboxylate transport system substrate-binding protein
MLFRGLALAGALFGALGMAGAASSQEVTLRLHQFLPMQAAIPARAITPWIEAVEKDSGGRIKVEHYPSMQLGGTPPSLYDQARDGVVDIIWTVLGYTPGRFPVSEAFELPFMVSAAEATSVAFDKYAREYATAEFADIHPIVFHTHGPGVIHVRGKGVQKLEDLKGLKLRGPTRIVTGMLEELGATAIGMPVPAVPEALSKGVIDGVVVPWEVTLPLKIPELVDSHTEFSGDHGLYTATFILAMNKDSYTNLPADLRAVIDAHSGPEAARLFGIAMDEADVIGRKKAEASGNPIHMLDEAETARWRKASDVIVDRWIAEATGRGMDGAGLVKAARDLVAAESAH